MFTNIRFTNLKIPILWETQETIQCTRSSKVSMLSNVTPSMSRLGVTSIETPDKTKSPWGGLTVLDLLTTKALVLLGFIIMHQWWHHSWILAKSLLREAATPGLSAGLWTTASNVESSAQANSLFSTSSNISLVYRIKRRGPNTPPCGMPEIIGIHLLAAQSTVAHATWHTFSSLVFSYLH